MPDRSKLAVALQILLGIILLVSIIWYIGIQEIGHVFLSIHVAYLVYALIAYFLMNLLFAVRLRLVLRASGHSVGLGKILLIQYGGMLASDFTPARSGYFVVPVMLAQENVPSTIGLSSILGIQSIEFLIKMVGGVLALAFLVTMVKLSEDLFIISVLGVVLMLIGALVIFLAMWSKRAIELVDFFKRVPIIKKIAVLMSKKITEFQKEAYAVKNVIIPILILTIISWVVKGIEWYFYALALNITQVSFIGFFLLHPLITALSFIPITPSGIGFQEGGLVGIFYLLGVGTEVSIVFALLARFLSVIEDLIGIAVLSKAGIKIFEVISNIRRGEFT